MSYLYHYHPKKNWMNDPNGLTYFNNLFHIYYQYNPKGINWGNISWGHAITKDFISYKEEEIVLKPDMEYDKDGCYSGNSIIIGDTLYVYYTSVSNNKQTQSVAYSIDGYNFIKYDKNPIIDTGYEARDPYVFKYNDELYMLIGTQNKVLLYKGSSPFDFKYVSNLLETDEFIECPNLVNLGDKYLFKYSSMVDRKDHFYIGTFNGLKFIKEEEIKLDLPHNYYASQMFIHDNKVILIGWIFNDEFKTNKPYNGVLSIPRIIEYKNNKLTTKPYIELINDEVIDDDIIEKFK